jgi:hypothetical protein
MTAASGLAQNYAQLVAARIGVGVGEAAGLDGRPVGARRRALVRVGVRRLRGRGRSFVLGFLVFDSVTAALLSYIPVIIWSAMYLGPTLAMIQAMVKLRMRAHDLEAKNR